MVYDTHTLTEVQFNVGPMHPLFNKFVIAEIRTGQGYDGHQIAGATVNPVHYPEDPEYCIGYDSNGPIYTTKPAYDEQFVGWVKMIKLPAGGVISAADYAEYQEYLRLKIKFDDVEVSDVCIETTVDNTINALINRHHEYCDLKKTQVLRFVNEMMEDEEFEDAIIQAVLKRAAQRTEGSTSTIMKAAKQAWNECTRNYW